MSTIRTHGNRPIIKMASGIRQVLLNSICRHEPEHYAVLAGSLRDPHRVTDCRPMPPTIGRDGYLNRGKGHVQLNASFIEYYLNMELLPADKYLLGVIHTHPSNLTHLSSHGDIPSIRGTLERAAQTQKNWTDFLAPIITVDLGAEVPTFTGWIVRLDQPAPIAARRGMHCALEEWMSPYHALVNRVRTDRWASARHKRWMVGKIYKCMRADITAKLKNHNVQ